MTLQRVKQKRFQVLTQTA